MTDKTMKEKIKANIHEVDPEVEVWLYGSRSRGTAREDSDWDVLVLLDKEKITADDHDNIAWPIHILSWDYDETIMPMLITKGEWKDNRTAPFRINVLEDAIPL